MNTPKHRIILTWVTGIVILLVLNGLIFQKEWQTRKGTVVLLPLSPADPRSRLQGDYMQIRYAFTEGIVQDSTLPRRGRLLIRVDERGVGDVIGVKGRDEPTGSDIVALNFRRTNSSISIGAEYYFFQEGQSAFYEDAAYGELRVDRWGSGLLVALLDSSLHRIEPPASLP